MNRLILKKLTKSYGKNLALNEFSFDFTDGVYGLLGPNGAGKSTLMNIITCNLKMDGGEIVFNGRTLEKSITDYVANIGYMPQQQSVYDNLTLNRFMYYMAALKGISRKDAAREIDSLLATVHLSDVNHRFMGSFSGGMKQRALIAQAMLGNPKIIILDEPTAGLDPKERVAIRELIAQTAKDRIVIVSTHVVSDIESIAKCVIVMKKGQIAAVQDNEHSDDIKPLEELYMQIFG